LFPYLFKGIVSTSQAIDPPLKSNGISIKDAVFNQNVSDRPQLYGAIPAISKDTVENYQTWYTRCVTNDCYFRQVRNTHKNIEKQRSK